jgi:hypothetical protein
MARPVGESHAVVNRGFAGALLWACSAAPASAAQRSSAVAGINTIHASIPTPLRSGKRVFISYEMGDITAFPSGYSGDPERAYGDF